MRSILVILKCMKWTPLSGLKGSDFYKKKTRTNNFRIESKNGKSFIKQLILQKTWSYTCMQILHGKYVVCIYIYWCVCVCVCVHTNIYHKNLVLIFIFGTHFVMVSTRTDVPKKDSLLTSMCACELLWKESWNSDGQQFH